MLESMILPHDDLRIRWAGAVSLERTAEWTRPWRLPHTQRSLFFPELMDRAGSPAGVRLEFETDARRIAGSILPVADASALDFCVDGSWIASEPLAGRDAFAFSDLPAGLKHVELWLPQWGGFSLHHLELNDGAAITASSRAQPRWITYGSSITQCRTASVPTQTWPSRVARALNLDLLCLGFGGQCHLDGMVARVIRDERADFLSMCVGINIYGRGSLNARSFASALIAFVEIVREKHAETPFLIISPIHGCERETNVNAVGWTLGDYRDAVAGAVQTLTDHGDKHLMYLDGRVLFDADLEHHLPDRLHPSAEGYVVLADNFLRHAAPLLFK